MNCIICNKKLNKRQKKFCSHKCRNDAMKNKIDIYDNKIDGRSTFRKRVLKYKEKKCEKCGSTKDLQVHHIKPAKYTKNTHTPKEGDHSINNSMVLCRSCHYKLHSKGIKRFSKEGICLVCGKKFKYYPKSNRGKYCSKECFYKRGKELHLDKIYIKNCNWCQKKFETKFKRQKYCSKKCKQANYRERKRDLDGK